VNSLRPHKEHIVINHLENLKGLVSKTGLIKSLRRYYKHTLEAILKGYHVYETTPTTFVVLSTCNDAEFSDFTQRFNELSAKIYINEKIPSKHCTENTWLIKPANENQGRGIEFFKNNFVEMKKFLLSKPPNTHWVVQKYIERPLLYNNRKFDIRVWAVATWKRDFYYFRHGYIRTSSHEYTMDSNLNYVHLTNNCLQVFGDKYGAYEEGNTIGFEQFIEYLKQKFPDKKLDFDKDFISRMKDLMIDSYLATKHELNPNKRDNCFEFLGYDFLIDEDLRVWLIEVNTNPYIGIPNKYIEGRLPKMLNDLLEIVLDPYFPPANNLPPRDESNQFELLYSERKNINQRRSYEVSYYPLPELDPLLPMIKAKEKEKQERKEALEKNEKNSKSPPKPIKKRGIFYDFTKYFRVIT